MKTSNEGVEAASVLPHETVPPAAKHQKVFFIKHGHPLCLTPSKSTLIDLSALGNNPISTLLIPTVSSVVKMDEVLTNALDDSDGQNVSQKASCVTISTKNPGDGAGLPTEPITECSARRDTSLADTQLKRTGSLLTSQLRKKVKLLQSQNWKLKKKINELRKNLSERQNVLKRKPQTVNEIVSSAEPYLSPLQLSLFKAQMMKNRQKERGHRWSVNDKLFGLQFLYVSGKAYHFLSQHLHLPSEKTLRKFAAHDNTQD